VTLLDPRARHQTREPVARAPAPVSLRVPPGGRGWTTGGVMLVIPADATARSLRDAAAECMAEAERRTA
jgi:hypothetical protein